MTDKFLKVNKDFFKLGLAPVEILILSQVDEFNRTTGDCFMSDKSLAEAFGVSESTISRAVRALEARGFITRATKNVKGGRERHITINLNIIEDKLNPTSKMTVDGCLQPSNCLLSNVNLTVDNKQNDFIKDKGKDKLKDNNGDLTVPVKSLEDTPEAKEAGSVDNPIVVDKEWLAERYNHLQQCANGLFKYNDKFYTMAK